MISFDQCIYSCACPQSRYTACPPFPKTSSSSFPISLPHSDPGNHCFAFCDSRLSFLKCHIKGNIMCTVVWLLLPRCWFWVSSMLLLVVHYNGFVLTSHCGSKLQFLEDQWFWASFYMPSGIHVSSSAKYKFKFFSQFSFIF